MPIIGFDHNFIRGLSDFWQRFFADSDQLEALYDGAAVLIGQAYLDLLSNVLNVSLVDAPAFNKEYYKLLTIREDQVYFERGASGVLDRWNFDLPTGVVRFASLDNKVIEPTAQLQERIDYDLGEGVVQFRRDPTDPTGFGNPLDGYARRQVDVGVAGKLVDTADDDFVTRGVLKGDVVRILEVGPTGTPRPQRKLQDLEVVVVRLDALYLNAPTPPLPGAVNYVILRKPAAPVIDLEAFTFAGATAPLAHTRIVEGSVKVYAKRNADGADVVEGLDYNIDYELGRIVRLTTWRSDSLLKANYEWRQEVYPSTGGTPPRYQTGTLSGATTVRVTQLAFWAPDALIDRFVLSNNFGALIGRTGPSSENYRAFLLGIFQLYILGPVMSRIESAMNVICGLPVIRDDGERLLDVVTTGPDTNIVRTTRSSGAVVEYEFPKATPLRADIQFIANWGVLAFNAFEPLATVVRVTDYVQDPSWWHNITIPKEMFSTAGGATVPDASRRAVSAGHVHHIIGAEDKPRIGDPGLYIGADEFGRVSPPGHPVLRRRFAFVMMDRFFKAHMFFVGFDSSVFTLKAQGVKYTRIVDDLNDLIMSAKPAHTYLYVQPSTAFTDTMFIAEAGYYQPQTYDGADPNAAAIYASVDDLPSPSAPFSKLGFEVTPTLFGNERFLFADRAPRIGETALRIGDYFRHEEFTESVVFSDTVAAITLPDSPAAPARAVLVSVFVDARVGGKRTVENVDYSVDYTARTVRRLTAWDATTVNVYFLQARLINIADGAPDSSLGDMPMQIGGPDPSLVRADYDPAAVDLFDNPWPVSNHRDMSFVERPLTIRIVP